MATYELVLDDGLAGAPKVSIVEAEDDEEASALGKIRLSASPNVRRVIVRRGGQEIAIIQRAQ
ncbi:hypothetical protein [Brevundimonas sp.]|uniref:hypothetical protein n=1 Tax=Brevundimonas sp. TaxID=1871086 RepID=UPI0028A0FE0A|nr:hypothetical protein [Brevundimonas sp.]